MKFYAVFDGFELKNSYKNVYEAIEFEILDNFQTLKFDLDRDSKTALIKLAKSDRKRFGVAKVLPRFRSQKVVNSLLQNGFLELEKSRETPPKPKRKNEKLPRELRRYIVHDKVHFKTHFLRFWFRFIEPNFTLLENGKKSEILEIIKSSFENYASLPFEILSINLLKKHFNDESLELQSFWNKEFEIDIFGEILGGVILGEVKYRDRKVCKNVLNLLDFKAKKLGISPKFRAIFSRSGFSRELVAMKSDEILLFDIKDFRVLFE